MEKLIELGLKENVAAIRETFDRATGHPILIEPNLDEEAEPKRIKFAIRPPSDD